MRIAVLIIGLLLGLLMFLQSVVINILADVADEEASEGAAAVGLLVALCWLVACAIVIAFPRFSMGLFIVAGLLAFLVSGDFPDMAVWGTISLILAGMSYLGYRGKRKNAQKEAERNRLIQQGAQAQMQLAQHFAQQGASSSCPQCGVLNSTGARFCASCGGQLGSAPQGARSA